MSFEQAEDLRVSHIFLFRGLTHYQRFYPERRLVDVLDIRRRTTTTYRHYPRAATRGW